MKIRFYLAVLLMVFMAGGGLCDEVCPNGKTYSMVCDNTYYEAGGGGCPFIVPVGCTCTEYCR